MSDLETENWDVTGWQGALWGVRFACSDYTDEKRFKRKCKQKRFRFRAQALGGKRMRARSIAFNNIFETIRDSLPNAPKRQIWQLASEKCRCMAAAWTAAFDPQSQEPKGISHKLNQEYLANLDKAANNEAWACSAEPSSLTAQEASCLTNIQQGIAFMFLCRMPECL